jgi:hypothetical protein
VYVYVCVCVCVHVYVYVCDFSHPSSFPRPLPKAKLQSPTTSVTEPTQACSVLSVSDGRSAHRSVLLRLAFHPRTTTLNRQIALHTLRTLFAHFRWWAGQICVPIQEEYLQVMQLTQLDGQSLVGCV